MFEGEMASLREIQKTNTIRVPHPIKVMDLPGSGAAFAMEYIKMRSLNKYVKGFILGCWFSIPLLFFYSGSSEKTLYVITTKQCLTGSKINSGMRIFIFLEEGVCGKLNVLKPLIKRLISKDRTFVITLNLY